MMRRLLALIALPVAFFAVVVLRGGRPRVFWSRYWDEAHRPAPQTGEQR